MRIDDAILMAFIAGDLPPEEMARVEAAVQSDNSVAARLERIRGVRTALRTVYDSVVQEPVPERLRALLGDVASQEPPSRSEPPPAPAREIRWAPLIAAAAAGAILGALTVILMQLGDGEDLLLQDGGMRAGAALERALDTQLAREPGAIAIGFSFRAHGAICRTFVYERRSVSGFACRDESGWSIRSLQTEPGATTVAPSVLAGVDIVIDGEPLNEAVERRLRQANWRE